MKKQFRCIHCGDYFSLQPEDQELYDQEYYSVEPDTCDECAGHQDTTQYDDYSDADPGL